MFRAVLTAAACLSLAATPALAKAQQQHWRVLLAEKGVTVMGGDATGPMNARKVRLAVVFSEAIDTGVDRATTDWVVDCGAQTVNNVAGLGSLGGVPKPDVWRSSTQNMPKAVQPNSFNHVIADYACTGKRPSTDSTVLGSSDDAMAYAEKLAKQ